MQILQHNTTLQGGKYKIERVLGQGGFGITYLARNTVFDMDVAIKEFFMKDENEREGSSVTMPNSTKTEIFIEQKEKFKKEAKRMFSIKNEHVIGVHDLFEENDTAYYVMDYVDGENLAERLKLTSVPMTEKEVRELLPQLLDALKTIHNAGIWHLDLKPANIMIDKSGNVKLIDFGASKQFNAQKGGATTSTAISYTNGYAPREQMEQNYDKFGPWTDIYALGATIYALLTNNRPPLPTTIDDDMSEDKHCALPFPNGISKEIKDLVLAMMHTNKNQRPQNVEAIMAVLSNFNQKEIEVSDTLSEETIVASDKNGVKEEHNLDLINNKNSQIESLNKNVIKGSKTNKQTNTRLILSFAVIAMLGCIGWIIYNNSYEKKSLNQKMIVDNDSDQISTYTPYIKENQAKVFKALIDEGYTGIGNDEAEFGKLMNDSTNRRKVYDALTKEGYTDIGKDYDEFEKLIYQEYDNSLGKAKKN